ncbi:thiocillin/thiostrepton family thiazolyl peptide [Listeria monocytogenes]|uniref:Thiocillin/thiostrepton family thiazolyl peptide n=1 Tax=Listeria monocytogenes TaxID=1639 RepID=A0AAN2WHF5_LISMN|nr:thiocillin/thiostrepton family thiazolyl peptide [Listeria monocytogenes]EAC3367773.1 thiocillin/thiostrepton family thiazolyl peptide [Listeria monocytogenes]EAC7085001.1 thiocillin/thiostrepton family thiazolyl peptide [Listeria monocytogenes]EAC8542028.1 thiocillin/thiostrepton family thiazolyl peptide [Listeria monocytogenes]EAC8548029.1 thiocillin/thiostrepton family thiazolyl peptide [Listeria monocytogenes]
METEKLFANELKLDLDNLNLDDIEFVSADKLSESDETAIMGASCTGCVCTCSCCTT